MTELDRLINEAGSNNEDSKRWVSTEELRLLLVSGEAVPRIHYRTPEGNLMELGCRGQIFIRVGADVPAPPPVATAAV